MYLVIDQDPIGDQMRAGRFHLVGAQFHATLMHLKVDRQVQVAGALRADPGRKVHRQISDHDIAGSNERKVKMRCELGSRRPVVPLGPLDGAGVPRHEKAARAQRPLCGHFLFVFDMYIMPTFCRARRRSLDIASLQSGPAPQTRATLGRDHPRGASE